MIGFLEMRTARGNAVRVRASAVVALGEIPAEQRDVDKTFILLAGGHNIAVVEGYESISTILEAILEETSA